MAGLINLPSLVQRIQVDTRGLKQAEGDFATFSQKAGRRMASVGDAISTRLTLPLLALGGASVKMSNQFDKSLSQIVGLVGESREQVQAWRDDILELGPAVGKGPQELADALFFVTSAGFEGAQAMEILDASARAATAGLGETAQVADAVTSAVNAYGASVLTAGEATDVMVATVREGKLEASQLAPQLGRLLPVASELGISFDQVGAGLAFLTRSSGDASLASTQLSGIMSKLLKPTEMARKELGLLGLTTEDLRNQVREEGLLATLQGLRERVGDNSEAFGRIFEDVQAVQGALALTGAGAEQARDIFDSLSDSTGALDAAFNAAAETSQFRFDAAMSSIQGSLIELGAIVAPIAASVVESVSSVVGAFTDLPDGIQTAIVSLLALVAIGGPVLSVTGRMVTNIKALTDVLKAGRAASAVSGLTTAFSSLGSILLGPVGIGLAAVAGGLVVARIMAQRARDAHDNFAEAADKLAASLGEEGAAQSALEFADANANVIRQLREMDDLQRQQAELFSIGFELVQRGEDPEEVFARLQQLAFEAGIEVPLQFSPESLTSMEAQLAQVRVLARGIGTDLADALAEAQAGGAMIDITGLTTGLQEDLTAIAGQAAGLFDTGNLQQAVALLEAVQTEVAATAGSEAQAAQATNYLTDEFLKLVSATGFSIRSNTDVATTLREVSSEASTADRRTREVAAAALELADAEGITLTQAIEQAGREFDEQAAAAAASDTALGGVEGAAGDAAQAEADLAAKATEAAGALREQQTAALALADPFFAAADAADRNREAQAKLEEVLADSESTSHDIAAAQRDVASSAFEVEGANRELVAGLAESSGSLGELIARLDGYVDSGLISEETAAAVAEEFRNTGGAANEMVTGIDAAAADTVDAIRGIRDSAEATAAGVGRELSEGLARGIDERAGSVEAAAARTVNRAMGAARKAGRIESPSRLFAVEVGQPLTEGIAEGMLEKMDATDSAVQQVIDRLADRARDRLGAALSALTAGQGVSDASQGLADAERELRDARRRADQLPRDIAEAEQELARARREGARVTAEESREIGRAQIALTRARDSLRALKEEQAGLPQRIREAREAIRLAASGVSDARADRRGAERDVAAARARAELIRQAFAEGRADRFNLEDAESDLAEAEAALEQADQAITTSQDERSRATDDLNRLLERRRTIGLDLREAEYGLADAGQRLNEVRREARQPLEEAAQIEQRLKDLREEQAGVSDRVADAERGVEDATLGVVQAQLRLMEAGADLRDDLGKSIELLRELGRQAGLSEGKINDLQNALVPANTAGTFGGGGGGGPAPSGGGGSYTVRSGDTLSQIAARHGLTLSALLAKNPGISDPNRIYPGQVIALRHGGLADPGDWMVVGEDGPELMRARMPTVVAPDRTAADLIDAGDRRGSRTVNIDIVARDAREAAATMDRELGWQTLTGRL